MSQWLLHGQEIDISLDRQHRHQYNYERALPSRFLRRRIKSAAPDPVIAGTAGRGMPSMRMQHVLHYRLAFVLCSPFACATAALCSRVRT